MSFHLPDIIRNSVAEFASKKKTEGMWKAPVIASFSADHHLLPVLKEAVSPDHLLPEDILPGAKSVVVFFVPFENRIVESNLKGEAASKEWASAYLRTNELLGFISVESEKAINRLNYRVGKIQATHNFDERTLLSRWSHRHIAWIAGLGSFGINNMLITSHGCCGRFGSFVTDADSAELGMPLPLNDPSPLPEKCLNKRNGSCGLCIKKCPVGAYAKAGIFDRQKCYAACLNNAELHKEMGFADVCGKCLVGLPCSCGEPF
jgi:epoxyqueuosine reductase QueG